MTNDPIYFAHTDHPITPGTHEPVLDHLAAVGNHCLANTPSDTTLTDGTRTQPVLYVMAWCHDIGKLTTWWQEDHDNTTVSSIDRPPGRVADHSFIGGVTTWWVLRELGYPVRVAFPASIAVARHHGTLPDLESYSFDRFVDTTRWETVRHQVANIDQHSQSREIATQLLEHLSQNDGLQADPDTQPDISWQRFVAAVDDGLRARIGDNISGLTGISLKSDYKSTDVYYDLLELWGGLKGADTPASAGLSPPSHNLPDPAVIDTYVDTELSPPTNPETPVELLNQKREETRQETLKRVESLTGESREQPTEARGEPPTNSGENYQLDAFVTDTTPDTNESDTETAQSGVYRVTLPTGAGKTLTVTQAALKLNAASEQSGPLIHILPYTSIIEQTEGVYQTLFDPTSDFNTETNALQTDVSIGVDHYLADNTSDADEEDTDTDSDDVTEMAYQSWHTDITLSTTVQLWESLYGPSKSQATKLPQFYNSTIIIDEPQTTPPTWWSRVEQLIDTLYTVFDATVILMSATHPPLEYPTPTTETPEDAELAPAVTLPDNVTVTVDQSVTADDPIPPTTAAQRLRDEIDSGRDSILSIHNTVSNARAVAESLIADLDVDTEIEYANIHTVYGDLTTDAEPPLPENLNSPSDFDRDTVYNQLPTPEELVESLLSTDADVLVVPLTTRNRPCDRSRILDGLSDLLEQYPRSETERDDLPTIVALTTQLIEAGVDISFESLYRDIAPYDSLVQAAGRCNRNYEYGIGNGNVTVWQLDAQDPANMNRIPAEYVYNQCGINELNETVKALTQHIRTDRRHISQQDFLGGYDDYREEIATEIPHQTPDMDSIDGATMSQASLIDDDRPEITVYVSQSSTEDKLLEAYRRADQINHTSHKLSLRECLRHIGCDVPRNRDKNPITKVAHQLDDDLYLLDQEAAENTDLYGWKGLSNDESKSVTHRLL